MIVEILALIWQNIKVYFGYGNVGVYSVWDVLMSSPEAEWTPKPRGQHRTGTSVWEIIARIREESLPELPANWRDVMWGRA